MWRWVKRSRTAPDRPEEVAAGEALLNATLATLQNPVPDASTTVTSACQENAAGAILSQGACRGAIRAAQCAENAAQQQLNAAQSS